jgi:hypothetical protein
MISLIIGVCGGMLRSDLYTCMIRIFAQDGGGKR